VSVGISGVFLNSSKKTVGKIRKIGYVHFSLILSINYPFFLLLGWSVTELKFSEATTGLLYQLRMVMDDDKCGTMAGMLLSRGNRSNQRKSAPVPIFPPHIPHDLTRARTREAAVGSQLLTARPTD
jgi:hypothetical protein